MAHNSSGAAGAMWIVALVLLFISVAFQTLWVVQSFRLSFSTDACLDAVPTLRHAFKTGPGTVPIIATIALALEVVVFAMAGVHAASVLRSDGNLPSAVRDGWFRAFGLLVFVAAGVLLTYGFLRLYSPEMHDLMNADATCKVNFWDNYQLWSTIIAAALYWLAMVIGLFFGFLCESMGRAVKLSEAFIESDVTFDDVADNTPLLAAAASMLRAAPSRK
jgi:hypothetical protein